MIEESGNGLERLLENDRGKWEWFRNGPGKWLRKVRMV